MSGERGSHGLQFVDILQVDDVKMLWVLGQFLVLGGKHFLGEVRYG